MCQQEISPRTTISRTPSSWLSRHAIAHLSVAREWMVSLLSPGLILLCVFWLAPQLALCQSSEDQVATHFRAGQEALKQGEFTRATEEFRSVLTLDPTLVEAEVNLGLAYHSLSE